MNTYTAVRHRVAGVIVYAFAMMAAPILIAAGIFIAHKFHDSHRLEAVPLPLPMASTPRSDRLIAVVVTGVGGAEMTDFLLPFEVLARTKAIDVYVVAPERRLIPLSSAVSRDGGIDLVPHLSFQEYDKFIGRTPDLLVVPFLPAFPSGEEPAVVPWLQRQAGPNTLLLSICAGAEVMAAAGLLDDLPATSHPSVLPKLEKEYPSVRWAHDVRFVENARGIHSGSIASGIDATLAVVRRILGVDEATRIAHELNYPYLRFQEEQLYPTVGGDWWAPGMFAYRVMRESIGVVLYEGVGEIALGSVFDSFASTTGYVLESVAQERRVITSRHGLHFVPRHALRDAPAIDRVIVPGEPTAPTLSAAHALAMSQGIPLSRLHDRAGEFPYDAALRDLARRDGALVARSVARSLNYPAEHLQQEEQHFPIRPIAVPSLIALFAALGVERLRRLRNGPLTAPVETAVEQIPDSGHS